MRMRLPSWRHARYAACRRTDSLSSLRAMTQLALLVPTALALGALHSFAPDHLAAVSVFVSRVPAKCGRVPSWRQALELGARWGVGHSATIIIVGGALALTGLRLPTHLAPTVERVVGATLIVLGALALARSFRLHGHWHEHDGVRHWHLHSHLRGAAHDHSHGALVGIGMLHGLAGSGALVVALPAAVAGSRASALVFLVSFGIGTILSMSLFSALAGHVVHTAARVSLRLHRVAIAMAGVAGVGVGIRWIAVGGG
jgi:sulfite exporter TauE/SafE